jgi:hypothetical protein
MVRKLLKIIHHSDKNLNDLEIMKLFKDSLMKNKNLKLIDFYYYPSYLNLITPEALNVFLNDGNWSNETLESLNLDGKLKVNFIQSGK